MTEEKQDKKWSYIASMWGGLGWFLFIFAVFFGQDMWETYQHEKTERELIQLCSHQAEPLRCLADGQKIVK